jgi:hypothetical protein
VDDKRQEMSVTITRFIEWNDPRIVINDTHPFWITAIGHKGMKKIRLHEEFVEECLWIPKLHILGNARKMEIYRPLPTTLEDSPMEATMNEEGGITLSAFQIQITYDCLMVFHKYPFDEQVKKNLRIYDKMNCL